MGRGSGRDNLDAVCRTPVRGGQPTHPDGCKPDHANPFLSGPRGMRACPRNPFSQNFVGNSVGNFVGFRPFSTKFATKFPTKAWYSVLVGQALTNIGPV